MQEVNVSTFKATCLALLKRVRQTGQPLLITRRGEAIAQILPPPETERGGDWLGCAKGSAVMLDDGLAPTGEAWSVLDE